MTKVVPIKPEYEKLKDHPLNLAYMHMEYAEAVADLVRMLSENENAQLRNQRRDTLCNAMYCIMKHTETAKELLEQHPCQR